MSIDLSNMDLTKPDRTVKIVDKDNEKTGLSFIIRPKTCDEYQKKLRQVQDRMSTPKKVPAKDKREMNEALFMAQIGGWNWEGRAAELSGTPEFTPRNLKSVLYENGEHSAAIRMQILDALDEEQDFLDED